MRARHIPMHLNAHANRISPRLLVSLPEMFQHTRIDQRIIIQEHHNLTGRSQQARIASVSQAILWFRKAAHAPVFFTLLPRLADRQRGVQRAQRSILRAILNDNDLEILRWERLATQRSQSSQHKISAIVGAENDTETRRARPARLLFFLLPPDCLSSDRLCTPSESHMLSSLTKICHERFLILPRG